MRDTLCSAQPELYALLVIHMYLLAIFWLEQAPSWERDIHIQLGVMCSVPPWDWLLVWLIETASLDFAR